ncbi:MAG: hypothetical protein ABF445_10165 [Leuconostoc mesenteroides]
MKSKIIFSIAVVIGLIVFVGSPLFVQYNHWPQGSTGNGDWLSFWGSYLGIIPSGVIAYSAARYQIENEKKSQKEQFNHTKHIENLTAISKKLRALDSVFEYGVTHQYLFNNGSEAGKYFDESDGESLDKMMDNLTRYMYEAKISQKLVVLLLDIDMMPKVREIEVYKNINELNDKMNDLSNINSGGVPSGKGKSAYIKLIEKYKNCNDTYHRALKQIADEIYSN